MSEADGLRRAARGSRPGGRRRHRRPAAGARAVVAAVLVMSLPAVDAAAAAVAPQESAPTQESRVARGRALFQSALDLARQERFEEAKEAALEGLSVLPDDADGLNLLGEIHEQLGELDAATEAYERAMRADPDWVLPFRNLGRVLLRQEFYRAAVYPLQKARELDPDDASIHAWLGLAHRAVGRTRQAREAFESAWDRRPDSVDLALDVAAARSADGDLGGAIAAAERATELAPDAPEPWVALGDLLLRSDDVDDLAAAPAAYRGAVEASPGDPRQHVRLARAYGELGLKSEEEQALRQAIDRGADTPEIWFALGDALEAQTRMEEAIAAFTEAVERDPDFGPAYFRRGQVYFSRNRRDEAEADMRKALEAMPGAPGPLLKLAEILLVRGRFEEAEPYIHRAAANPRSRESADALMGRLLLQQGRADEAIPHLERATAGEVAELDALYLLGQALIRTGQEERGRQVMTEYQESFSQARDQHDESLRLGTLGRGRLFKVRGRVFLAEGRYEEALEQLEGAVDLIPEDPETWRLLADIYERLGRTEDARDARDHAAELELSEGTSPDG